MQCKTRHSCENNKAQNFHQKPQQIPGESKSNSLLVYAWYQCQPMPLGQNKDSVCRQCCQTDKEHIQILLKSRLHRCWLRMLVSKYVSDKFEMLISHFGHQNFIERDNRNNIDGLLLNKTFKVARFDIFYIQSRHYCFFILW